jgi:hypothetical protein
MMETENRPAHVADVHHAVEHWADLVLAAVGAPEDPATLERWARLRFLSVSTLRARCCAAGVSPKKSLDFARLLRAVSHARAERCTPMDLLDTKDVRTARSLLRRAGISRPGDDGGWPTATTFLDRQALVTSPWALAVLRRRLEPLP